MSMECVDTVRAICPSLNCWRKCKMKLTIKATAMFKKERRNPPFFCRGKELKMKKGLAIGGHNEVLH